MLRTALGLATSALAANRASGIVSTIATSVLVAIVALLFFCGAAAFVAMSGYWYFAERFDPRTAALIMAGVLLLVGLALCGIILVLRRKETERATHPLQSLVGDVQSKLPTAEELQHGVRRITRRYGAVPTVVGALGAGAVVALLLNRLT